MKEFRTTGPPGTGKTNWVKRQVGLAANKYGASRIVVCSLTRTAAANISAVQDTIADDQIGTLHSFAYRAVGADKIAESSLDEFNSFCDANGQPTMKLKCTDAPDKDNPRDDLMVTANDSPGERDLAEMNRLRARMIDQKYWPESVRAFSNLWNNWKRESGVMDFTDLISTAIASVEKCPGNPDAFFADESQDFSRLLWKLARKWGENSLAFVHVGDKDQILYHWAGVDPNEFDRTELIKARRPVLKQSYRVPVAVHALAVNWISQTKGRAKVEYLPRRASYPQGEFVIGKVSRNCLATYKNPSAAISLCKPFLESGKSVMFCVSCSYMLVEIISSLRSAGLPYHNPYRISRGDWNPLARGKTKTTATDRLLIFLKQNYGLNFPNEIQAWTNKDVKKWMEWVRFSEFFKRGFKSQIEATADFEPNAPFDNSLFEAWLKEPLIHFWPITEANLEWYESAINLERQKQIDFAKRIIESRGLKAIRDKPQIIVSTIHAAKGGEADIVFLFPDISPVAMNEWLRGGEGMEGIRRTFYVGMTRARDELIICPAASKLCVKI